jgi:hypothetical protein
MRPAAKKPAPKPKSKPTPKPEPKSPPRSAPPRPAPNPEIYERQKQRSANYQRESAKAGNDIGPIPDVVNPKRRAACLKDPEKYYKEYFPEVFRLPSSKDHREVFEAMEDVLFNGGFVPLVMARGSGKTAICRRFCIRAVSYGIRRYVFLIGADAGLANRSLTVIKKELRFNRRLLEDFPEICWPIRKLEGKAIRATGQHVNGEPTQIVWTEGRLVLPTVKKSHASGAIIDVAGITGQIRGRNELASDGREIRPDLFILDDPQTHESAYSLSQVETREQILMADIIEGAGPGEESCGIIPCTILRKGDLADRLFDKGLHPEFSGRKFRAMYSLPKNQAVWDQYAEVLRNALEEEDQTGKVNAFYLAHRAELEDGAVVAWPERKKKRYVTALQELMTLKILKPDVYASEYDANPIDVALKSAVEELTKEEMGKRLNNHPRLLVPHGASKLTAFIDLQGIGLLWYMVCAWRDGFTGSEIDAGTHPDQGRRYYTKSTALNLLGTSDVALHSGLKELATRLLKTEFRTENGQTMMIDLLLVDSGHKADLVYELVRQMRAAGFGARILPSKGEGDRASRNMPFNSNKKLDGEDRGPGWRLPPPKEQRAVRLLTIEVNHWKGFVRDRIAVKDGGKGSFTFWGSDPREHQMLIDHLSAEYRDRIESEKTGRTVDEFHKRQSSADEDLGDCLVGCAVAAHVCGVRLTELQAAAQQVKMVDYLEEYKKARGLK